MHSTSASLLERLRSPHDEEAWARFVRLYTPLLFHWANRLGLQDSDAGDLVQDVLLNLVRQLPEFRYDPSKRFRSWLHTVFNNAWRNARARRRLPIAADSPEPAAPDLAAALAESEHAEYLVVRALELMRDEFQPSTWKACWGLVVESRPAAEVAAELGLSLNAVYIAKWRVLSRLRRELDGFLG